MRYRGTTGLLMIGALLLGACTEGRRERAGALPPSRSPAPTMNQTAATPTPFASPSPSPSPRLGAARQGNRSSYEGSVSADGRFVAFSSEATNLVAGDTNRATDVFVRDRQEHRTIRVSVSSAGRQGNLDSYNPTISADGRLVSFVSWASNLVAGDRNGCMAVAAEYAGCADVFVHDLRTRSTIRVSVSTTGREGNERTESAAISRNGRFVVFQSWASTLVAGDTNDCSEGGAFDEPPGCPDIFVRDLANHTTERVSLAPDGSQFRERSRGFWISDDGRLVAWGHDRGYRADEGYRGESIMYIRERAEGRTFRVPAPEGASYLGQGAAALTGDGHEAIYFSWEGTPPGCRPDFAPPGEEICTGFKAHLFSYDLRSQTAERLRLPIKVGDIYRVATSADGRNLALSLEPSHARDRDPEISVYDRVTRSLLAACDVPLKHECGYHVELSPDGRFLVFASESSRLVPGDTNNRSDVFLVDRRSGTTSRVSIR